MNKTKIKVTKNGPYLVSGNLPLNKEYIVSDKSGNLLFWKKGKKYPGKKTYLLCRCGNSKKMPFCDGTHAKIGFEGTETAGEEEYLKEPERIDGPDLVLTDVPSLCASAHFCHQRGGTWQLTEKSNNPKAKKLAIEEAGDCPSGRLITWNKKTGKPIEPVFEKSASIVEDLPSGTSGPIWVKGKVPVEAENGTKYEERNRVTLCRCGKSENKPFCDSTHITVGFNDGDKNI